MTPERWQRVKELFNAALDWQEGERDTRLAHACQDDSDLRVEVLSLLHWAQEDASLLHGTAPDAVDSQTSSTHPDVLPLTEIGPYAVQHEIGRGGMGRVFLAEDRRLQRKVAIKVLSPRRPHEERDAALILREARAVARLSHPNIAAIHDVVEHGGRTYIVMEFLEGETLADRLTRGPLPVEDVLRVSIQIAAGLAHAHRHSIVHCDVKPANVFITNDDVVKLLDFGLARLVQPSTSEVTAHLGASQTLIRQRAGTPAYMSPEHLNGQPLDARSDVYSLGLVIHEMATARRPSLSLRLSTDTPTQAEHLLDPALPPAIRPIAARALATNPAYRYQSAAEVEAALRAAMSATQVSVPVSAAVAGRRPLAAAAVLAALLVAATWWTARNRSGASDLARPLTKAVVAVLPFSTPPDDAQARYLAAGLTEIVTNDLSTSPDVVVVSNASVRTAVGAHQAPADAARELGATHLVVGALRSEGVKLHAAMQVFTAASDAFSPMTNVDVTYADVVGKPRVISDMIRAGLADSGLPLKRVQQPATSATTDPMALEDYARGREYLDHFDTGDNLAIAMKLLDSALQRDSGFALAHAARSEARWRMYRRTLDSTWATRAQDAAFEAMRLAPDEPAVRYSAALVLQGTGRVQEAKDEVARVIALQPNNDEAHRLLGQLYAQAGDMEKAVPELQSAIELRPGSWENYHALGVVYFGKSRYQEAIAAFRRETELRPDNASPFQALGTAYHAIGDVGHALENYERAIAIAPSAFAYSNIGLIHYSRGEFQEAVKAYEQSAKISPREPVTHRNLADSLMKAGDTAGAQASYRKAVALAADELRVNPKRARLMTLQAVCYAKLHRRADAIAAIEAALAVTPPDNGVLFQAAVAYALLGDGGKAMPLLEKAVASGYSRDLIAAEEDLVGLRRRADFQSLVHPAGNKP